MPNGIDLCLTDFTQWRAKQVEGYFTTSRYRQTLKFSAIAQKRCVLAIKLMRLYCRQLSATSRLHGAIRNSARFVYSEIWVNAT